MSLEETTELWVLRAKVKAYESALAQAVETDKANAEAMIDLASELHFFKEGVRGFAMTLREWAVAAGGHTPSAFIAGKLLDLVGDDVTKGALESEDAARSRGISAKEGR